MIGILPVIDKDGKLAARLEWNGTMWKGKGEWKNFKNREVKKKIETAISLNQNLKKNTFGDMVRDAGLVRGWQGFAGWFQALAIALPSFGLDIDRENIIWPFKAPNVTR